jgi:hypothetical protein
MFNFRIIICADGTEIIDRSRKTPYNSLSAVQMVEYTEMDNRLASMDRRERRARQEKERKQKLERNPLYRFVSMCGMM